MQFLRSLVLAGAAGLTIPALASAEPQWGPPGVQPAYSEGYVRGQRAGAEDARRGDRYEFNDESDYRRSDSGYRPQSGDRGDSRDAFRRGFESGYRDGYAGGSYRGPGRYGPPSWSDGRSPRNDPAHERGLGDGYEAGVNDARERHRYDPISEGRYRSADRGYERWYGSREAYKNIYRAAFKQGYDNGFQDGRRYDRGPRFGGFFGFAY